MATINYPGTVKDLAVGDIVEYQSFMGGNRVVRVTNIEPKEPRGGIFDGTPVGPERPEAPMSLWGYGEQIRVIRQAVQS